MLFRWFDLVNDVACEQRKIKRNSRLRQYAVRQMVKGYKNPLLKNHVLIAPHQWRIVLTYCRYPNGLQLRHTPFPNKDLFIWILSMGHLNLAVVPPNIPQWLINYALLIGVTCWMMWSVTWQLVKEPIVGRS